METEHTLNSHQTRSAPVWCLFVHVRDTADWLDGVFTPVLLFCARAVRP